MSWMKNPFGKNRTTSPLESGEFFDKAITLLGIGGVLVSCALILNQIIKSL